MTKRANDLPVWGCWNTGENQLRDMQDTGYTPDWQLSRMRQGEHTVATFEFFSDHLPRDIRNARPEYFEPLWSKTRDNQQPVAFIGRNLLMMFRELEPWKSAETDHPFVTYKDGRITRTMISPWSKNAHHWKALGRRIGEYLRTEFALDYPDCPDVFIGDNNEWGHARLQYAKNDADFPAHLEGAERQVIIREVWDAYRLRRSIMLQAIREACPEWADAIKVYAYAEFGNAFSETDEKSDPHRYRYPWSGADGSLEWAGFDGVTCNVGYLHSWSTHDSSIVRSPQVEACNARYALDRYRQAVDPQFGLETHYWNGRNAPADEWLGVVRCVLWIMRQRRNRLFLGSSQTVRDTLDRHMQPLITAVEEVHANETLKAFWQHGTLVKNAWRRSTVQYPPISNYDTDDGYGHPYNWPKALPPEEQDAGDRWYLQHVPRNCRLVEWDTIGGPDRRLHDRWRNDREHKTPVAVYAIAIELDGRYLVYAHAPHGANGITGIEICPPGKPSTTIHVEVPVSGGFWVAEPGVVKSTTRVA